MTSQKRVLAMFPGQGSQAVGMGRELYEESPEAKQVFEAADQALGFKLSEICFNGPIERLTETAITQPAILTASIAAYEVLKAKNTEVEIVAAAGHSLGEYSALVAVGSISFEEAVQLVHKRGTFMQEAVPPGEGAMAAILGKELSELKKSIAAATYTVEIANVNAPGQVVIAGTQAAVEGFLEEQGPFKAKMLQVSAPFHCSLMEPARAKLAPELEKAAFSDAAFPVYTNVDAGPHRKGEEFRQNLEAQVCSGVQWVGCVENAIRDTSPELALEFGNGNVLSGLLRRIERSLPSQTLGNMEDFSAL